MYWSPNLLVQKKTPLQLGWCKVWNRTRTFEFLHLELLDIAQPEIPGLNPVQALCLMPELSQPTNLISNVKHILRPKIQATTNSPKHPFKPWYIRKFFNALKFTEKTNAQPCPIHSLPPSKTLRIRTKKEPKTKIPLTKLFWNQLVLWLHTKAVKYYFLQLQQKDIAQTSSI